MNGSPRPFQRADEGDLHVLFDLGSFVGAIASRGVERVVSSEEVDVVRAGADPRDGRPREGIPALTLASMLELDLQTRAWILLIVDGGLRVALGVGECVGAREIVAPHPLPRGAFRARHGAIAATFRLPRAARRFHEGHFGLVVDPRALGTTAEWAGAAQLLRPRESRREAG